MSRPVLVSLILLLGLGIVALGAAVLPFLRIGGMRLFRAESSDFSEKVLPQTRRFLMQLLLVYLAISVACMLAYMAAGMNAFDAVNHAMTTVSTGGFSTHDASIAWFDSTAVELVVKTDARSRSGVHVRLDRRLLNPTAESRGTRPPPPPTVPPHPPATTPPTAAPTPPARPSGLG